MSGHTPWAAVKLHRIVAGALRSAVHDHGSIDADGVASAAKRVVGQLEASVGMWLDAQIADATEQRDSEDSWRTPEGKWWAGRVVALEDARKYFFGG